MTDSSYGITKNLGKTDFDASIERVTEALKEQGFGVLTEIDVKATLHKKLDVDFRQYRILGACNPSLAHQAITSELPIGLLLPCNVIVFEEDDGTTTVSAIDPMEMFSVIKRDDMAPIAEQVGTKLRAVIDAL